MKTIVLAVILIMMGLGMSACERNDYQHPMHRNN